MRIATGLRGGVRRAFFTLPVLALLTACTSTTGATPPSLTPPKNVEASKIQTTSVTLAWERGSGLAPTSFVILRDGSSVGTAVADATSWTDQHLTPDTKYTYAVRAVAGKHSQDSGPIPVKTKAPALTAAAISGAWTVTYTVVAGSLSNAHPGKPLRPYIWIFGSSCHAKKACGGSWTIHFRDSSKVAGKYKHVNDSYLASMTKVGIGFCGSVNDKLDSATATIKVTKAAVVGHRWQATRFSGQLQEYFPAENGCSASYLKSNLDGVRKH